MLLIVLWQKNNSFVLSSSGGYLVSYLSVDAGLWALVLSIAVSSGFGVSLVYSNVVNTTMRVISLYEPHNYTNTALYLLNYSGSLAKQGLWVV